MWRIGCSCGLFLLGVCDNESADGLDAVEGDWAEGDDVAGFGGDDPVGGVDGDADVAVVVDGDGASVEDEVASTDGLGVPVDCAAVLGLGGGGVWEVEADGLVCAQSESGAVEDFWS